MQWHVRLVLNFLAHLSQRLIRELIVYKWSGLHPRSSSSSVVYNFKHLLLWNCLANQSQNLCGASLGRGTKVYVNGPGHLTKKKWLPCPYMVKTFRNCLLRKQKSYDPETWHVALGTQATQGFHKWWPRVNLDLFYGKVKWVTYTFEWGKLLQSH